MDAIPSLCNLSVLVKKGFVRLSDVNVNGLRARAVYELSDNGGCECRSNDAKSGFEKALCSILATGRSHARDTMLDQLLCGLLAPSNISPSVIRTSLVLVSALLNCAKEVLNERDLDALFLRWARIAVLQPDSRNTFASTADENSSMVRTNSCQLPYFFHFVSVVYLTSMSFSYDVSVVY